MPDNISLIHFSIPINIFNKIYFTLEADIYITQYTSFLFFCKVIKYCKKSYISIYISMKFFWIFYIYFRSILCIWKENVLRFNFAQTL